MNPISVLKTKAAGAKTTDRPSGRQDDDETGGQTISLVSYLETDNERLRQAADKLSHETAALRQELERRERGR
jgi:hypothetical protein